MNTQEKIGFIQRQKNANLQKSMEELDHMLQVNNHYDERISKNLFLYLHDKTDQLIDSDILAEAISATQGKGNIQTISCGYGVTLTKEKDEDKEILRFEIEEPTELVVHTFDSVIANTEGYTIKAFNTSTSDHGPIDFYPNIFGTYEEIDNNYDAEKLEAIGVLLQESLNKYYDKQASKSSRR